MRALLFQVAGGVLLLTLYAYALPLAQRIARCWVWVYTCRLPPAMQRDRADDATAFYREWESELVRQGHKAGEIGVRVVGNVVAGAWHDVAWRLTTARRAAKGRPRRSIPCALHGLIVSRGWTPSLTLCGGPLLTVAQYHVFGVPTAHDLLSPWGVVLPLARTLLLTLLLGVLLAVFMAVVAYLYERELRLATRAFARELAALIATESTRTPAP